MNAPPHIAGDGFALGLGEGGEERSHHFAGHRRSVNVLFLEVDADTERFQLSDGFQTFLGIAGKAGDGFYQHPVDQPSAAICQEPLEVLTLFSRCPSDTLICVYVYHSPVFLAGDQVAVVTVLGGEGVKLVIRGGADTGVCRNPQFGVLGLFGCLDGDDPVLLFPKRHAAVGHQLFRHVSSPPFLQHKQYHNTFEIAIEKSAISERKDNVRTGLCGNSGQNFAGLSFCGFLLLYQRAEQLGNAAQIDICHLVSSLSWICF